MTEPLKHWTTHVGQAAGHPDAFLGVAAYGELWLTFARDSFGWEAFGTLAIFMMTLFIQRTNRRDDLALHAELDELLRIDNAARSELTHIDEQEPEDIEQHRDEEVRKSDARSDRMWVGELTGSGVASGLVFPIGYARARLPTPRFCSLHGLDTSGALR
ncbi:MAG: low affinity iron permease family protein [Bradyrhizobium sp.]|uniref:low affinity iron permease family protein n=1 Tax=Bradyrhizobium sp. TaxID=376 RepID=UPI00272F95C7|nr:low affinity iron permease family protein [Bradyrhizobium sp.]MDP1867076.1 low affinity iron permease family protein [Bradyrhizobium sp.]